MQIVGFPMGRLIYWLISDPMAMCEKDVNKTSGWIAPFQHQYITTKDMDCHYILRMESGYVVHLDPFQLDIIESGFCTTEFVEVSCHFLNSVYVPFKIISAHMRRAN